MEKIWQAKGNDRYVMYTDGDCFYAQVKLGIDMENIYAVGYSCPNLADLDCDRFKVDIREKIRQALDETAIRLAENDNTIDLLHGEKLGLAILERLFEFCKVANQVYNEYL